ncbi:hypothetical protein [Laribacter hongkongensis]|uniref:hypothetical protein n=1 Tax=Laribacter hongkongensis TaxID=168471 RepID=UPI00358DBDE9
MIKEQGLRISQVCRDLDTGHRRDGRPPLDCPIQGRAVAYPRTGSRSTPLA